MAMKKRSGTMRREKTVEEYADGILQHNRVMLAQAITLIESNAPRHFQKAQDVLKLIFPYTGKSVRIGITGVPGAGKSTFIEAFGMYLCELGHKVAILAIDPSSTITGGSILGDKTRMEELSRHPNAFIRPSPSQGKLGGVHRKTRESILLCEAAGFDVIIVETLGVGQGETIVKDMVDVFLLLALTGAGDELQGMKKGIMELADLICINKADGDNLSKALITKQEYESILHFLQSATKGWQTKVMTCSALYKEGIEEVWNMIQQFITHCKERGFLEEKRAAQMKYWLGAMISDYLYASFYGNENVKRTRPMLERKMMNKEITVSEAADQLIRMYEQRK
ncbi:methylmalonyl Co-A mutase-associated GTPase MeaB [Bacillus songklensis]|uniref:Methylmalonyl Co-A mutase-associated GTPase MeaB n=1 Tax=Bacillus songklensis TaxID=1069116 RepID=A0ABV8B0U4_9BACI